jgi:hypothetical protein
LQIIYAELRGREIFNACRNDFSYEICVRYKERWWSDEFAELRTLMVEWFTELFERHTGGHYSKLRKSVEESGFINPIIVTSGPPKRREPWMIPPWASEYKYICENNGGSRLMLAQELDLMLPCIVNGDAPGTPLDGLKEVRERFGDKTYNLRIDPVAGVMSYPERLMHLGDFTMEQNKSAVRNSKAEILRRANKWLGERGL